MSHLVGLAAPEGLKAIKVPLNIVKEYFSVHGCDLWFQMKIVLKYVRMG